MVNMTMSLYPNCKDASAWDPADVEKFQKCTTQISRSNFKIRENMIDPSSGTVLTLKCYLPMKWTTSL